MGPDRYIYLNKVQKAILDNFFQGRKKLVTAICGRGLGKSTIIGEYLFHCTDLMPRSRGILGGPTLKAVKNRVLPSTQEHWERLGLIEGEDYVIGKIPPKDWDRPVNRIEDYSSSIAFWNGSTIDMVSFFSEGAARGGNYQYVAGDEMAMVKRENFGPSVFPTLRGMRYHVAKLEVDDDMTEVPFGRIEQHGLDRYWLIPFDKNPFYRSVLLVTSMPYLDRGQWLLDYEHNPQWMYIEGTPLDNIEVLGPDYVPTLQASMHDLEFRVEVLNERITRVPDGFYPNFDPDKHVIETSPYRVDLPLHISFDFGKFACIVVAQEIEGTCYVVDSMWVRNGSIPDLMDKFVDRYHAHAEKTVSLHGDVQGNRRGDGDVSSLWDQIEERLVREGWSYFRSWHPHNPPHAEKFVLIGHAMAERDGGLPPVRIHMDRCKALIISIQMAPMKEEYKKDKRSEHPDSGTPSEEATHLSDAFDYLYWGAFSHRYNISQGVGFDLYLG